MEELKALFGEEALDYATFETKLAESGLKLANLAGGGYVASDKYAKLQRDFDKYKSENDVSRYSDYDAIKAERDSLAAEKAESELSAQVVAAGVGEKFRKFVLSEVKGLVTEGKDFAKCLVEYLKTNEQFVEKPQSATQSFFLKGGSSVDLGGTSTKSQSTSEKMNNFIKGVIGK